MNRVHLVTGNLGRFPFPRLQSIMMYKGAYYGFLGQYEHFIVKVQMIPMEFVKL